MQASELTTPLNDLRQQATLRRAPHRGLSSSMYWCSSAASAFADAPSWPQTKWFLRAAAVAGPAAVITLEAGWIVTEVGRQPWIVYNMMKVEDAVTANTGVWIMFFAVVILYAAVGTTAILVLRGMSRRFRRGGGFIDLDTPYGPSTLTEVSAKSEEPVG